MRSCCGVCRCQTFKPTGEHPWTGVRIAIEWKLWIRATKSERGFHFTGNLFLLPNEVLSFEETIVTILLSVYSSFLLHMLPSGSLIVLLDVVFTSPQLWAPGVFFQGKSDRYIPIRICHVAIQYIIFPRWHLRFLSFFSLLPLFSASQIQVDFLDVTVTSKIFGKQVISHWEKQQT